MVTTHERPATIMTTRAEDRTVDTATLAAPLRRFRIAALVTGLGLLGMVVVMVIRYGFDNPTPSAVYSPVHGVIFMFYMGFTIDLAIKAGWAITSTLLVLLAGCVPLFSFLAERAVTRRVQAGRPL